MSKKPGPSVSLTYERCTILSSVPMTCFLCGVQTQPMVTHSCSRPQVPAKVVKKLPPKGKR